jgi:hypothetical protein
MRTSTSDGRDGLRARTFVASASSPCFTFPDEEILASTSFARDLRTEDEREEWDAIFSPISQT